MGELGNSSEKLFSSLSKLSSDSRIEADDGPVFGQSNENKVFAIFCSVITVLGLASFVLVLTLRGFAHPLIFQTLFVIMSLCVPSIAMSGFLKVFISGTSVKKHILSVTAIIVLFVVLLGVQLLLINLGIIQPNYPERLVFEGYEQLYLLTLIIALAVILLASMVLLIFQYKRKWLLALASFAVFLFVLYLEVNAIAYFNWFPEI